VETLSDNLVPHRLYRISEAASYLRCTPCFIENLIRLKIVPSLLLGKRRVIDVRDLDDFVDRMKKEAA
jgi:excisionase family DNA binding protein